MRMCWRRRSRISGTFSFVPSHKFTLGVSTGEVCKFGSAKPEVTVETNVYWLWLLSMGSLIFLMQAGFFLLEGGQVRSRDVSNVMMKMTGHLGVGIIVFLLGGFALKQYGWPLFAMPEGWRAPWEFISSGPHS